MTLLDPSLWEDHPALLKVPRATTIVSAAQLNVIEFHAWNATKRSIDKPDRIIFDLDPDGSASITVLES
nr:hypothetical protein [Cupriavidus sp. CV2]